VATEFIIGFREALEAALIVGIMLAYLRKTGHGALERHVLLGAVAGVVASVLTAIAFNAFSVEFEGASEQLFEAATMLVAASVLSYMMLWMARNTQVRHEIGESVKNTLAKGSGGLFLLAFVAVYREGVETVLLLAAAAFNSAGGTNLPEFVLGISGAIIVGWLIFEAGVRVDLKTLFLVTSVILLFFASGLVSHAVAELQEASVITFGGQQAWDTSGLLGKGNDVYLVARSLFGYTPTPSVLEAIAYLATLLGLGYAYRAAVLSARRKAAA